MVRKLMVVLANLSKVIMVRSVYHRCLWRYVGSSDGAENWYVGINNFEKTNGEPGTGSREPGTGNWEPGTGNREPGTGDQELGTGNRGLGTGNWNEYWEPGIENWEPGTGH